MPQQGSPTEGGGGARRNEGAYREGTNATGENNLQGARFATTWVYQQCSTLAIRPSGGEEHELRLDFLVQGEPSPGPWEPWMKDLQRVRTAASSSLLLSLAIGAST